MLDIGAVDLDELGMALEQNLDEMSWWLDPRTGEVRPHNPYVDDETGDDLDEAGFVAIPPLGSRDGYRDMADFIAEVPDHRARDLLERAIQGDRPFRRFKDTLLGVPDLRTRWFAFRDARSRRRAIWWLAEEELIDDEAAERAAANHPDPSMGDGTP